MKPSFFGRLKQKISKSSRSNSSLMLPIQYCDSPTPSHTPLHPDESLSFYYNKNANEVENISPDHQAVIMRSGGAIGNTNHRVSKEERESTQGAQRSKRYGGILHHCRRNGFRSTILSFLPPPISKRRESDDRIYLVSEKDLESYAGTRKNERDLNMKMPPPAHLSTWRTPPTLPHSAISSEKPILNLQQSKRLASPQWFPFFSYLFAIGSLVLLIYNTIEFKNSYGTIISLSPFNIMLGPNTETFLQSGALFIPCMRSSQVQYQCTPNNGQPTALTPPAWKYILNTDSKQNISCSLQDICGLVPVSQNTTNLDQFYRFITAIAVHSGVFQWIVNMVVLLSFGTSIERRVNSFRFALSWIISGSFGYMFATLFLNENTALMGCFGSINGVFGLALVHIYPIQRSGTFLLKLILLFGLGIVLGYLPGYNNFCHLGGLIAGILAGIVMVPTTLTFHANKKGWTLMMFLRLMALTTLGVSFYLVLSKFYSHQNLTNDCTWCGYLSCLPIFNMCN